MEYDYSMPDFGNLSYDLNSDYIDFLTLYYQQLETQRKIVLYIYPVLLVVGTIGNVLSLLAMYRLTSTAFSTCAYLTILSICDIFVLYARCGNTWYLQLAGFNISHQLLISSQSLCKVYPFVFNFVFHMSKWLVIAVSVEGLIAMKNPQKALTMCTLSKAKSVTILLTVLLVCVNVHFFWTYEITSEDGILLCTLAKNHEQLSSEFVNDGIPIIEYIVGEGPIVITGLCSLAMIILMAKGQHMGSAAHQQWRLRYTIDPATTGHLQRVYFTLCFLYFVCNLPYLTCIIVSSVGHQGLALSVAQEVSEILRFIFMSTKFFVYLSCPKFRTAVCNIFRCGCCRSRSKSWLHENSSAQTLNGPLLASTDIEAVERSSI